MRRRWARRHLGITPACAGNSFNFYIRIRLCKDHPRVCGEQYASRQQRKPVWGSPPRVRGTGAPMTDEAVEMGITPACAGNRLPKNQQERLH